MKSKTSERSENETSKIGEYGNSLSSPLNWHKQISWTCQRIYRVKLIFKLNKVLYNNYNSIPSSWVGCMNPQS